MEISGKILREVEFRDRLRGYDTDEVDEFLEKVAMAVDELHEEIVETRGRAERAERQFETLPPVDDDSLRRTLVLAQRTADLAISEARDEAGRLIATARTEAEALLNEARQLSQTLRSEAEREMEARVQHLGDEHDRLTHQIGVLTSLVEGERGRIIESLQALLGYVGETLSVPTAVSEAAEMPGPERPQAESSRSFAEPAFPSYSDFSPPAPERAPSKVRDEDDNLDLGLPDVEAEIGEDAAIAFSSRRELEPRGGEPAELDPDEELWSRWASAEGDDRKSPADSFQFDRREPGQPRLSVAAAVVLRCQ